MDYWSVGIVAFEMLTAGMIAVFFSKMAHQNIHPMLEAEGLLEQEFFTSAVDACWKYTKFVGGFKSIGVIKIKGSYYNTCPVDFLNDSWLFVNALMHHNPIKRLTLDEALKSPFVTKVTNPTLSCLFRRFLSFGHCGACLLFAAFFFSAIFINRD